MVRIYIILKILQQEAHSTTQLHGKISTVHD